MSTAYFVGDYLSYSPTITSPYDKIFDASASDSTDTCWSPTSVKSSSLSHGLIPTTYYGVFLTVGKARAVSEDSEDQRAQVEEAFTLFTRGTGGGAITIAHLRRIAKDLKQEIDDQQLKDMILEANGGIEAHGGAGDWRRGVTIEEFESVMKRAGVFG